jgi:hypothetical protein
MMVNKAFVEGIEVRPLSIEEAKTLASGSRMRVMRIGDFLDGELSELKSMEHHEAGEALMDMLDRRNGGIATMWHRGYGVYGFWFDNEYAYINVGTSCD